MEPKQALFLMVLAGLTAALLAAQLGVAAAGRARLPLLVLSLAAVLDVNLFFEPYRGTSAGLEVGTTDAAALAALLSLALERRARLRPAPPGALPVLLLGAWCAATLLWAERPALVVWELARFLRAYLLFALAASLVRGRDDVERYVDAVLAALLVQAAAAGWQLLTGLYRVRGTHEHSNALGITLVLLAPLALAHALAPGRRAPVAAAAFAGAALAVVYTRSRASLALLGLGTALVVGLHVGRALLLGRRATLRRALAVCALGAAGALPVAVKVADGVAARFREAPRSSGESRERANDAARAMLRDHPLGVGLDHYVLHLDRGYGEEIEPGDRTIVHNAYLLMAAEAGWPGVALFVAVAAGFLARGAAAAARLRDDGLAATALGLTVGWALAFLQQLLEWALRHPQVLFQATLLAGVLVRLRAVESRTESGGRGTRRAPGAAGGPR